jgi:hypothetical protein
VSVEFSSWLNGDQLRPCDVLCNLAAGDCVGIQVRVCVPGDWLLIRASGGCAGTTLFRSESVCSRRLAFDAFAISAQIIGVVNGIDWKTLLSMELEDVVNGIGRRYSIYGVTNIVLAVSGGGHVSTKTFDLDVESLQGRH